MGYEHVFAEQAGEERGEALRVLFPGCRWAWRRVDGEAERGLR
jgi:hypothetical protein